MDDFKTRTSVPVHELFPANMFALGLSEIMDENFKGLAEVRFKLSPGLNIFLCAENIAIFFKNLIAHLHGDDFLRIKIYNDEEKIRMDLIFEGAKDLSRDKMIELSVLARNAGFEPRFFQSGIELCADIIRKETYSVYAQSPIHLKFYFKSKFAKIFYYDLEKHILGE